MYGAVPPSNPYFTMDVTAFWVAGESYDVTCVAPDAKPEAEVFLYKGASLVNFKKQWFLFF